VLATGQYLVKRNGKAHAEMTCGHLVDTRFVGNPGLAGGAERSTSHGATSARDPLARTDARATESISAPKVCLRWRFARKEEPELLKNHGRSCPHSPRGCEAVEPVGFAVETELQALAVAA
jgi:hypothetical protein